MSGRDPQLELEWERHWKPLGFSYTKFLKWRTVRPRLYPIGPTALASPPILDQRTADQRGVHPPDKKALLVDPEWAAEWSQIFSSVTEAVSWSCIFDSTTTSKIMDSFPDYIGPGDARSLYLILGEWAALLDERVSRPMGFIGGATYWIQWTDPGTYAAQWFRYAICLEWNNPFGLSSESRTALGTHLHRIHQEDTRIRPIDGEFCHIANSADRLQRLHLKGWLHLLDPNSLMSDILGVSILGASDYHQSQSRFDCLMNYFIDKGSLETFLSTLDKIPDRTFGPHDPEVVDNNLRAAMFSVETGVPIDWALGADDLQLSDSFWEPYMHDGYSAGREMMDVLMAEMDTKVRRLRQRQ